MHVEYTSEVISDTDIIIENRNNNNNNNNNNNSPA